MNEKLIVGNWKMNDPSGFRDGINEIVDVAEALRGRRRLILCPPATRLERLRRRLDGTLVELGGQDCHAEAEGAFTGGVSAEMLRDAGASRVLIGHSEVRRGEAEDDRIVALKAARAVAAGLAPILCVGESAERRDGGGGESAVVEQLYGFWRHFRGVSSNPLKEMDNLSVAYEPLWAIGSGRTPSLDEIDAMHGVISRTLGDESLSPPILYGGSVTPLNAGDILRLESVSGVLAGGASLRADTFGALARAGIADA